MDNPHNSMIDLKTAIRTLGAAATSLDNTALDDVSVDINNIVMRCGGNDHTIHVELLMDGIVWTRWVFGKRGCEAIIHKPSQ